MKTSLRVHHEKSHCYKFVPTMETSIILAFVVFVFYLKDLLKILLVVCCTALIAAAGLLRIGFVSTCCVLNASCLFPQKLTPESLVEYWLEPCLKTSVLS